MLAQANSQTAPVTIRLKHPIRRWLKKRNPTLNPQGNLSGEINAILEEKFKVETGSKK